MSVGRDSLLFKDSRGGKGEGEDREWEKLLVSKKLLKIR